MPECQNCGGFVTETYARVFTPSDIDQPRVCPQCEDKVRSRGEIREVRTHRKGDGTDPVSYDPEKAGDRA